MQALVSAEIDAHRDPPRGTAFYHLFDVRYFLCRFNHRKSMRQNFTFYSRIFQILQTVSVLTAFLRA
jgi:hypothetical protein